MFVTEGLKSIGFHIVVAKNDKFPTVFFMSEQQF